MAGLRFYAQGAPVWWPWHAARVGGRARVPVGAESVLLDNGAFHAWRSKGLALEPGLVWAGLARVAAGLARGVGEVVVIAPDMPGDPEYTLRALEHRLARSVCSRYRCLVAAHAPPREARSPSLWARWAALAAEKAAMLGAGLAVPFKVYCSREGRGRLAPMPGCQERLAAAAARVAREHGVDWLHALAPMLSPRVLRALAAEGFRSFDTSSWTRPNTTSLRRASPRSADGSRRELYFAAAVARLAKAGVPLEAPESAIRRAVQVGGAYA